MHKKASPIIVPFYRLIRALEDTAEITLTFTFLNPPPLLLFGTAAAFSSGISSAFTSYQAVLMLHMELQCLLLRRFPFS